MDEIKHVLTREPVTIRRKIEATYHAFLVECDGKGIVIPVNAAGGMVEAALGDLEGIVGEAICEQVVDSLKAMAAVAHHADESLREGIQEATERADGLEKDLAVLREAKGTSERESDLLARVNALEALVGAYYAEHGYLPRLQGAVAKTMEAFAQEREPERRQQQDAAQTADMLGE